MTYTQCKLTKYLPDNTRVEDVSFIPSKFARRGKILNIKINDEWIEDWLVAEVYNSSTVNEEIALKAKNEYRDWFDNDI